jgi:hypothetical protein
MELATMAPPPPHPVFNGGPDDWQLIERILEMRLPNDYKTLINTYGTGCFFEFLYLLSPFAPFYTAFNLLSGGTMQLLSAYEAGRKEFPQYAPPFPAYPHKTGLFPWATTINGDTLFWLRDGGPDQWGVVICDSKFSERYDYFKMCATDFLCQLMLGKLKSKVFPQDVLVMGLTFTPYTEENPSVENIP